MLRGPFVPPSDGLRFVLLGLLALHGCEAEDKPTLIDTYRANIVEQSGEPPLPQACQVAVVSTRDFGLCRVRIKCGAQVVHDNVRVCEGKGDHITEVGFERDLELEEELRVHRQAVGPVVLDLRSGEGRLSVPGRNARLQVDLSSRSQQPYTGQLGPAAH